MGFALRARKGRFMARLAFRQATHCVGVGRAAMAMAMGGLVATTTPTWAGEPNAQRVSHFVGTAGESVPIQVPAFHGIEPRLSLNYSSEARNGFAGMGWSLSGVSTLERVNPAYGFPMEGETANYQLDGQLLRACEAGEPWSSYPSCATGGTHYTAQESYLRINRVSDSLWVVYGKDGTKTEFTPIQTISGEAPLRLGQSRVVETHGHQVTYEWAINASGIYGNTYLSRIHYSNYVIDFVRETRPDVLTRPGLNNIVRQHDRLKSVIVRLGPLLEDGEKIRGYQLTYATEPPAQSATGKSLLTAVQMFGKNLQMNTFGGIIGGTSAPAQTFTYTSDDLATSIVGNVAVSQNTGGGTATSSDTLENVVWSYTGNAHATGDGSTLTADEMPDGWDKWGHSTRALSSGTGYVEFTYSAGQFRGLYLGPNGFFPMTSGGGQYVQGFGNGAWMSIWPVSIGDKIRLEVVATGLDYKINGTVVAHINTTVSYPVVVFASLYGSGDEFKDVRISGSLVNYWGIDCGGQPRFAGDFNGDARKDFLCRHPNGSLIVTLATATGFSPPTIWASHGEPIAGVGDFDNDGRDDVLFFDSFWGTASVGRSDGTDFGAITSWGGITGRSSGGYNHACRMNGATIAKVADFTGDGKADVLCYNLGDPGKQFVAVSTGTSFTSEWLFGEIDCPTYVSSSADTNADGREDLFCMSPNGDVRPLVSLGSYFFGGHVLVSFCSADRFSFGDWNGDGTTDAVCANNGRSALQMGDRFVELGVTGEYCLSGQRLTADLDGDGSAEWICNNPGAPANDIQVRKWLGLGFGAAQVWRAGFCDGAVSVADANGDGKQDLMCESSQLLGYSGTGGAKEDLLASSSNGIGGSSTITYNTTTQHLVGSTKGLPVKYIVVATTANDGRTDPAMTSFHYDAGAQNDAERKFFGFENVMEYGPPRFKGVGVPPATNAIGRHFRVDKAAAGRLDSVLHFDSQGRWLSFTQNEYATTDVTGPGARSTVQLSAVTQYKFDGVVPTCPSWPCLEGGRRTKSTFTYDMYGNLSEVANSGDLDVDGDETLTRHSRTPNTTAYIVGLTSLVQSAKGISGQGDVLGWTENTYDGIWWDDGVPTKGDLTQTEQYLVGVSGAPHRWVKGPRVQFDPTTGNAIKTFDSIDRETSHTAYADSAYPMFPTSTVSGGATSTASWDAKCVLPSQTTDPNGVATTQTTDALCRPDTTSVTGAGTSTVTYWDFGNPNLQRVRRQTPGPNGTLDWSETYFDGFGRTYRTVRQGPDSAHPFIVVDTAFDSRGNVQSQSAPYYANAQGPMGAVQTTTFQYDELNRLTITTLPDNNTRTTNYTGMQDGFFKTVTQNELHQSTTTLTDVFGRVRRVQRGPTTTIREYDDLGRLTMVKQIGIGMNVEPTWTYSYDSLGRMLTKTDPDAGTSTYTYDDDGRVTSQVDAMSQATIFEYDVLGRNTRRQIRTGGISGTAVETTETVYGTDGNLHNAGRAVSMVTKTGDGGSGETEKNGKLQFVYDALGRVTKQTRTIDGMAYVVERNYDAAGYLLGMKYPDMDILGAFGSSGSPLVYDGAGRLKTIPNILTSLEYNALGAPLIQLNANLVSTTKTYDASRHWLTDIVTAKNGDAPLQNLHYELNDAGMAKSVTSNSQSEAWLYEYDGMNFLESATNEVAGVQSWTYDNLGRMKTNSRVIGEYSYEDSRPHAVAAVGTSLYQYKTNGNLEIGGGRTLEWNVNNQITGVVMGSTGTTFEYGPDGARIKKTSGGVSVKYPFGDDYEIAPSGTVTKYFNAGFGPIAKKVGTSLYWLHSDRLGSISATTDSQGAQVLRRSYRSYGELMPPAPEPVIWRAKVGTSSTGNTLSRTANTTGNWDAGAVSAQSIGSSGYVEVTATGTGNAFVGLSNGNGHEGWWDIDFGLYLDGPYLFVYEPDVYWGSAGTIVSGDRLRVSIANGVVTYLKNGSPFYTSQRTPVLPLIVDTSILNQGTTIQNAVISGPSDQSVSWTSHVNTSSSGGNLWKTGSAGNWDGAAVSTQTINGDGYVEATASVAMMFGLSHGNTDAWWADIDYAMFTTGVSVDIYEYGIYKFSSPGITGPQERLKVAVEGGVVKYYRGGQLFYTSTIPPVFPLLVDTSIHTPQATILDAVISGAARVESLDYIGQRTDAETGLTYLHARYYDPVLGVFLSPDPIGADLNTYRYAGGDPVNRLDPSGLDDTYSGFCGDYYDGPACLEAEGPGPTGEGALGMSLYLQNLAESGIGIFLYTDANGNSRFVTNPEDVVDAPGGYFVDTGTGNVVNFQAVDAPIKVTANGTDTMAGRILYTSAQTAAGYGDGLLLGLRNDPGPNIDRNSTAYKTGFALGVTTTVGLSAGAALEVGAFVAGAGAVGSRTIGLKDGFYEAGGSAVKFSAYYYEKLWSTGRGAPFVQAEEVLRTATRVTPDRMPGFNRYTNGFMEMVYNPATKEVFHLQMLKNGKP
jgi:RHS repeat-associated protein